MVLTMKMKPTHPGQPVEGNSIGQKSLTSVTKNIKEKDLVILQSFIKKARSHLKRSLVQFGKISLKKQNMKQN